IDLVGGRLGRIQRGRPVRVEAFGGDPMGAARAFVSAGARWIHVVDTDRAFSGHAAGVGTIRDIAALPVRVQASGGLRTDQEVAAIRQVAVATGRPVIAAGGIATLEHVLAVAGAAPSVEGAIVGSALYEGGLDLPEALRTLGDPRP